MTAVFPFALFCDQPWEFAVFEYFLIFLLTLFVSPVAC